MFYHINGTVAELEPSFAVIECAGVGFAVNISMNTAASLGVGEKVKLYISESIGENNFDLYGFMNKSEKQIDNYCYRGKISLKKKLEEMGFVYEK